MYEIAGTSDEHRKKCQYDFVVAMNSSLKEKLKLKRFVIVEREVEDKDNKEGEKRREKTR